MNEKVQNLLKQILEYLASGNYDAVVSLTNGVRLSTQEIRDAVTQYGRPLLVPPNDAYALADVVEVKNSPSPKWSIVMPLWTKEEGRSDLSIELTFIEQNGGLAVELDDIHVL